MSATYTISYRGMTSHGSQLSGTTYQVAYDEEKAKKQALKWLKKEYPDLVDCSAEFSVYDKLEEEDEPHF